MKVVMTGADGFLGWHLRARLRATTPHEVVPISAASWSGLTAAVADADAVIHLAGVNRDTDAALVNENTELARQVADAVAVASASPLVLFANSIQAGNGTAYGEGKAAAAHVLARAAKAKGAGFIDVMLPNLFGEHGRPHYNSFVATFAHLAARGEQATVNDREVGLLHVQEAAETFIGALDSGRPGVLRPASAPATVHEIWDILRNQSMLYQRGDIPALPTRLHVQLFNTLRAAMFPHGYPMPLVRHTDHRGSLVETVRAHGSEGQTFVSTSLPGVTRGQHYHLRKIERFVVLKGTARICLRRVLTDEVVSFDVTGDAPAIVDMPTLWVHSIHNTGDSLLTTLFWSNELFNPHDADTYPEEV